MQSSDGSAGDGSLERTLKQLGNPAQHLSTSTPFQGIDNGDGNHNGHVASSSAAPGFQGSENAGVVEQSVASSASRKRMSEGHVGGAYSPERDEGPSAKRRRANAGAGSRSSPSASRSTSTALTQGQGLSKVVEPSSRNVSHSSAVSNPAGAAEEGQPEPAEVRASYYYQHGGGGTAVNSEMMNMIEKSQRGTREHGAAAAEGDAEDHMRLTCPVPICRQVYQGKKTMLSHMRTHNEQVRYLLRFTLCALVLLICTLFIVYGLFVGLERVHP